MKIIWRVICLILGHNKILKRQETSSSEYKTYCTQCHTIWDSSITKEAKDIKWKTTVIGLKGRVKVLQVSGKIMRVEPKKTILNFYLL